MAGLIQQTLLCFVLKKWSWNFEKWATRKVIGWSPKNMMKRLDPFSLGQFFTANGFLRALNSDLGFNPVSMKPEILVCLETKYQLLQTFLYQQYRKVYLFYNAKSSLIPTADCRLPLARNRISH